jgi:hypothetical protein
MSPPPFVIIYESVRGRLRSACVLARYVREPRRRAPSPLCVRRDHDDARPGRDCDNDDQRDAEPQVEALVFDEARGDALVDDVALLEEQLPGRHRGGPRAKDAPNCLGPARALNHLSAIAK